MEKYDIFVSYRRDGGEALAYLISERLKQKGLSVFYDVESLRSGKFNDEIFDVISNCTDVIVVLPQNSLDRCEEKDDWLKKEIAYAIESKKNIIPVMMRNFKFPYRLPKEIDDLRNFNGISINNMEYFEAAFEKLLSMLECINIIRNKKMIQKKRIKLSISLITLSAFIVLAIGISMLLFKYKEYDNVVQETEPSYPESIQISKELYCNWIESGFLFKDSDSRYLNEDDIIMLSQIEGVNDADLIRYAINEIYARHNYSFAVEEYSDFFQNYDWYDGYLNGEEAFSELNEFEQRNMEFLIEKEKQYE